jgi:hypothetical protein
VVLCERERRTSRDAVSGRWTLPDTERGRADLSLAQLLDRKRKIEARLKGTSARGPARGRKQAEKELEQIENFLDGLERGLARRDHSRRARARKRRQKSLDRLEAARTAITQRKDVHAEWVIKTFGSLVDGLKAGAISPAPSPIPPRTTSSNADPQVDISILQRLGFVKPGKLLGDQIGWSEAWIPEPGRRLFFLVDLRDRRRPCAVFVVCDPERQAHQLFALKRIKGRFGRQEYRFVCPHTGRLSTAISYSEGAFFLFDVPHPTGQKNSMRHQHRALVNPRQADGKAMAKSALLDLSRTSRTKRHDPKRAGRCV